MYTRLLRCPDHSFLLLGPRATGKSTWLRSNLPGALWFDLLKSDVFLSLTRDPSLLRRKVLAAEPGTWVVIDEVQRIPALLPEVHALTAEHEEKYKFALCGSSARKLRRRGVDLLAGRVFVRNFMPLTVAELGDQADLDRLFSYGSLPKVCRQPDLATDILDAYVKTYLIQEIRQEALVKDLASFDRFLEVAAIMNGQLVNVAGIARDAGVARPTVQRYLSVLTDTLIGAFLPTWNPRLKVREVARPKFYLFDTGVVRALAGALRDPVEKAERGPLLETLVHHELRARIAYGGCGGKLQFWRTPSGREVDFIWSRGKTHIGIEVKAGRRWRREWSRSLCELLATGAIGKAFLVYLGSDELMDGNVRVLPFLTFARHLMAGEIIP